MGKTKVTEDLLQRLDKALEAAGVESIKLGEGLTRAELRALERANIVEKIKVYEERKYREVNPPMHYVWKKRGAQ